MRLQSQKKAKLLRALAAHLDTGRLLREEGIGPEVLSRLLAEAADQYGPETRPSRGGGHLVAHVDGACRGNPGPSGAGIVISDAHGRILLEDAVYLGVGTNNVAEYQALLHALRHAVDLGGRALSVFSDSELMIRQLRGEYKVRDLRLRELHAEVLKRLNSFEAVTFSHLPREENKRADQLANKALDEYTKNGR